MSEFFRAAAKCDAGVVKQAPMYIDRVGLLEEVHKHDALLDQALKTRTILDELEAKNAKTEAIRVARLARDDALRDLTASEPGRVVEVSYHDPPTSETALAKPPGERQMGSRAIWKRLEQRLEGNRTALQESREVLRRTEEKERREALRQEEQRKRDAERGLQAVIVSRQLSQHEAEQAAVKAKVLAEQSVRRAHPIDVLHRRIAEELASDHAKERDLVAWKLQLEAEGLTKVLETEEVRALQYKFHRPSTHVPPPW